MNNNSTDNENKFYETTVEGNWKKASPNTGTICSDYLICSEYIYPSD